jgi:hypothetical protein
LQFLDGFGLDDAIARAIAEENCATPTPIKVRTMPMVMSRLALGCTAGRMKKNEIKTLAGDRVAVEVSPCDLEKGRLIFVIRTNGRGPARVATAQSCPAKVNSDDQ